MKKFPIFPQDWTLKSFIRKDDNKKIWYENDFSSADKLYSDFS
jgi:hypothetical protein